MLEILAEREKLVKKIGEYKKKFMLTKLSKRSPSGDDERAKRGSPGAWARCGFC
jgi:chorismate mutase